MRAARPRPGRLDYVEQIWTSSFRNSIAPELWTHVLRDGGDVGGGGPAPCINVVGSDGVNTRMPVHEIDRNVHAPQANNVEKAMENGTSPIVTRMEGEAAQRANRNAAQAHAPRPRRFAANATWEEFPFASTYEGGQGATPTLSPGSVNSSHGQALKTFYQQNGIKDGDLFYVRVVN